MASSPATGTLGFLCFQTVAGVRLVDIRDVVEVIPMVALTSPDQDGRVEYRGLLHFRGRVVPVFEPDAEGKTPIEPQWFLIVVRSDAGEMALVARDLDEVIEVPASSYTQPPTGSTATERVVSAKSAILRVVEPARFLERSVPTASGEASA